MNPNIDSTNYFDLIIRKQNNEIIGYEYSLFNFTASVSPK